MKDFNPFFTQEMEKLEQLMDQVSVNNNDPQVKLLNKAFANMFSQIQQQIDNYDHKFLQGILSYNSQNYNPHSVFSLVIETFLDPAKIKNFSPKSMVEPVVIVNQEINGQVSYDFHVHHGTFTAVEIQEIFTNKEQNELVIVINTDDIVEKIEIFIDKKRTDVLDSLWKISQIYALFGEKKIFCNIHWPVIEKPIFPLTSPLLFFRNYIESQELKYFFTVEIAEPFNNGNFSLHIPMECGGLSKEIFKVNCLFVLNKCYKVSNPVILDEATEYYPLTVANSSRDLIIQSVEEVFLVENNRRIPLSSVEKDSQYLKKFNFYPQLPRFMVSYQKNKCFLLLEKTMLSGKMLVANITCSNNQLDEYTNINTMEVHCPGSFPVTTARIIKGGKEQMESCPTSQLLKFLSCQFVINEENIWSIVRNWIELHRLYNKSSILEHLKDLRYFYQVEYRVFNNIPCPVPGYQLEMIFPIKISFFEISMFKRFLEYYIPHNSFINIICFSPSEVVPLRTNLG